MPGTDRVLSTYLNDHHAAAVAGTELARRVATQQRQSVDHTGFDSLAQDQEEDLRVLRRIMAELEVPVRAYKAKAAWAAEKLGRFKLNGRVLAASPSSPVVELEGLTMLVTAKAGLWRSLLARAQSDGRLDVEELAELGARADSQVATVRRLHGRYAEAAFG